MVRVLTVSTLLNTRLGSEITNLQIQTKPVLSFFSSRTLYKTAQTAH